MAEAQSITPYQPANRQVFCATWQDPSTGKRIQRSLGTSDKNLALILCMELENLSRINPEKGDPQVLAATSASGYRLWFGEEKPVKPTGKPYSESDRTQIAGLRAAMNIMQQELVRRKHQNQPTDGAAFGGAW